jgi:hypothetical protein
VTHPESGLEQALARTEELADATLRRAGAVMRELKKAKTAAATGQVRELRRALAAAAEMAGQLEAATADAQASYAVDETAYLSSGDYAKELLAAAAGRGLAMFEEDERLLCYPSLVRIVPGDAAVEIDRKRERRLRPSVLVDRLAAVQQRPPRFRAEPFLESLLAAYELVVGREGKRPDAVVRLDAVWGVLTLLPGQAKDYTKPEFARDLYLLDQSGVVGTRSGRTLRWHASSGTRGSGVLTTVARTGQQQRYWGVSFTAAGRA